MKKSSMSAANAEPVSSVVANANRTNLVRTDQPDQEGVDNILRLHTCCLF